MHATAKKKKTFTSEALYMVGFVGVRTAPRERSVIYTDERYFAVDSHGSLPEVDQFWGPRTLIALG